MVVGSQKRKCGAPPEALRNTDPAKASSYQHVQAIEGIIDGITKYRNK